MAGKLPEGKSFEAALLILARFSSVLIVASRVKYVLGSYLNLFFKRNASFFAQRLIVLPTHTSGIAK